MEDCRPPYECPANIKGPLTIPLIRNAAARIPSRSAAAVAGEGGPKGRLTRYGKS
jgi:hypothetical protein